MAYNPKWEGFGNTPVLCGFYEMTARELLLYFRSIPEYKYMTYAEWSAKEANYVRDNDR